LQAGALLFALAVTLSLWVAPAPAWGWRLLAGAVAVVVVWNAARAILFQRGPGAVQRFVWAADGRWRLQTRAGWVSADISSRTAALGPWILLVWKDVSRPYYALLDAGSVSRGSFRALRGRLKLALSGVDPK
jgi:hypothetical protein